MSVEKTETNELRKMMKKKMEKQPTPVCRDYLDMDTDEEEFGRQETPEQDDELPAEPEKPVFTKSELSTLVQYVKDLTVFSTIEELNWSSTSLEIIQEYFYNPSNTVLTITHTGKIIQAHLDFPHYNFKSMTYFLRSQWQIYTPENFMSTVVFGSVNENFENSLLKYLEIMFEPIAINSDEWPEIMKDKIFSNINKFLMCLNNLTFDPMGLTVFYVPREGIIKVRKSVDEENKFIEKGFIERLERVARFWIKQIRAALCGVNSLSRPICSTILEQIKFWNYRFENLSSLHHQLRSNSILGVIKKLEDIESSSVLQFHVHSSEVDKLLAEATSNIIYLNLFVDYCKDFDIPEGIEDYSTKILHLIRFVGSESEFYNSTEQIDVLCRALGTQIIDQCKKYIDLNVVLEGDPNNGKIMLNSSIKTCKIFLKLFHQLASIDEKSNTCTISKIDESITFCHIDTFTQRCKNLIEISDARIVFDRFIEVKMIPGAKGLNHELEYKKIEEMFTETLNEIKQAHESILDVTEFIWLEIIADFSLKIQDIDNKVKNLIHEIFKDVVNVEEGIESLYAMKRFVLRSNLKKTLEIYWLKIWRIFEGQLEDVITNLDDELNLRDISMTNYAGVASFLRIKINYLSMQFKMLIDASDWFGDNNIQEEIIKKYKRIQSALAEKESLLFSSWEKEILSEQEIKKILNEPVIKFSSYPNESFIEINLKKNYLDYLRSSIEWKILQQDEKTTSQKSLKAWKTLKHRYNEVELFCKFYNSTLSQWTTTERLLFQNILNDIKTIIKSGLSKNTWSCESVKKFFSDCHQSVMQLKEETIFFKNVNKKFKSSCSEISKSLLIIGTNNLTYTVDSLKKYLKLTKEKNFKIIKEISNSIIDSILLLKHKVQYGEMTPKYWKTYVQELVKEFKASIVLNVQHSLQSTLKFFNKDFTTDFKPLINITMHYSKNNDMQVKFVPTIEIVKTLFDNLFPLTSEDAYSTEEFTGILKCDIDYDMRKNFIENDKNIIDLSSQIQQEIKCGIEGLMEFTRSLEILKGMTKIQEALNVSIQNNSDDRREILETEILECKKIMELILSVDDCIRVHYFNLNIKEFKSEIFHECEGFKDMLFVELSKFIASKLILERMPDQTDSEIQ